MPRKYVTLALNGCKALGGLVGPAIKLRRRAPEDRFDDFTEPRPRVTNERRGAYAFLYVPAGNAVFRGRLGARIPG